MRGKLRKRRLALVGALALALGGCTPLREYVHNGFKVGPNYQRPAAPAADHWIDAADVRVRSETADDSHWWTVFGDPVLDSLVAGAYEQNLTLREAGFRVLQARAQLGVARGNLFPQAQQATGSYNRTALSSQVANREFILERFYSQWDQGFSLAWELDFWGRFRRSIEAAADVLDASVESYDDVLVTLIGDVASNYVQMRILEKQIELTRANIALQRETLGIAVARFEGGQATELDVDQSKSVLAQTEALIPELEIQLRTFNNQLCVLLGIPPEELSTRLGAGAIPTAPATVAVGIPADLLTRRPDVRRVEREAAARSEQIGIAVADWYPSISLTGSIGFSAEDISDLYTSSAFQGKVGPSFNWNVLNYGRILNNVRAQDAVFQETVARYQNTVLRAQQEVEDGLVTFLRAQQRARYYGESVAAAEKAVKIAVVQYKGGLIDFNRVATLEQNLVDQQNFLAQARGEIALGLIQVYRALGGGWQLRCPPDSTAPADAVPAVAEAIEVPPQAAPAQK